MTVAEALPTLTDAEKLKTFDKWVELAKRGVPQAMEVDKGSSWSLVAALAYTIADRKPDLAPWTPGAGKDYYFMEWGDEVELGVWGGDTEDIQNRDFGNVFRTREEAEAHAARLRVFNRICQMMLALDWAPPCDSEVFRAMREYFTHGEAYGVRDFDAIREQLETEGAL